MAASLDRRDVPLPGAPDPWAPSAQPALRPAPPFLMTEMIQAEPGLAARIAHRMAADGALAEAADAIRQAAAAREPITVTGCGTSQHAAMGIAALLRDALDRAGQPEATVSAVQAFEASRRLPHGGMVLAVSHDGGTAATNDALRAASTAGAATALITVSNRSPGAALARHVLATEEQDQSWCHTVGYLSPLVVGAWLHGVLVRVAPEPDAVAAQVQAGLDEAVAERMVRALAGTDRLVVVGSGADFVAARELALKVEEGVRLPAVAHELETIRHGHLAAANERTGLVAFLTDGEARGADLVERTASVLRAAAAIGMPAVVIGAVDRATGIGPVADRHVVDLDPGLPRSVAALLVSVIPLQLLAERLARARGTNPDAIGREDPRQAAAASA